MTNHDRIAAKRHAIAHRKARTPIEAVRALAGMQKRPPIIFSLVRDVEETLMIGRVARGSSDDQDSYDAVGLALRFCRAGVDALWVDTEALNGDSGINDLMLVNKAVACPVIHLDLVLDEYQVVEARAAGAAALVLTTGVLDDTSLRSLVSSAQRNRMSAIVRVANEDDLKLASALSPQAIALEGEVSSTLGHPKVPAQVQIVLSEPLRTFDGARAAAALRPDAVLLDEEFIQRDDAVARARAIFAR